MQKNFPLMNSLTINDILKDSQATLDKLEQFDAFQSPKHTKKLEFIYKKHFPEQPELSHHTSVLSQQST